MSHTMQHEAEIPTGVPGLVLWRWPRMTFTINGVKRRSRSYSVTHQQSGMALLPAGNGAARHRLTMSDAMEDARKLGDVRWRGKPFDWTQPADQFPSRVRTACWAVAGFIIIGRKPHDKATVDWAERNNINLTLTPLEKAS
jgi:hypothetical protein